ncbi:hypothetical protein COW36_06440 [bacterium (Candidatus Blackallbacteria) CG17_big_fil_post_rev_8_21_14_2_50_48_46]|uniref:Uncharacterized protein n=1 Tax=bacterium (Candidatus Blackallbacteria) CG17_big_fil_post_rev_8_21_14_2_50_48_46 TaxID=2014261 RepID=A0A2M7G7L6_9BACT|nr:MAG: hypothetical protein COW36_06440 [bacterium (Candidatus Blackallbacteria) CG17_big_fil_post_rev_8_21_14_2_50_48_46]
MSKSWDDFSQRDWLKKLFLTYPVVFQQELLAILPNLSPVIDEVLLQAGKLLISIHRDKKSIHHNTNTFDNYLEEFFQTEPELYSSPNFLGHFFYNWSLLYVAVKSEKELIQLFKTLRQDHDMAYCVFIFEAYKTRSDEYYQRLAHYSSFYRYRPHKMDYMSLWGEERPTRLTFILGELVLARKGINVSKVLLSWLDYEPINLLSEREVIWGGWPLLKLIREKNPDSWPDFQYLQGFYFCWDLLLDAQNDLALESPQDLDAGLQYLQPVTDLPDYWPYFFRFDEIIEQVNGGRMNRALFMEHVLKQIFLGTELPWRRLWCKYWYALQPSASDFLAHSNWILVLMAQGNKEAMLLCLDGLEQILIEFPQESRWRDWIPQLGLTLAFKYLTHAQRSLKLLFQLDFNFPEIVFKTLLEGLLSPHAKIRTKVLDYFIKRNLNLQEKEDLASYLKQLSLSENDSLKYQLLCNKIELLESFPQIIDSLEEKKVDAFLTRSLSQFRLDYQKLTKSVEPKLQKWPKPWQKSWQVWSQCFDTYFQSENFFWPKIAEYERELYFYNDYGHKISEFSSEHDFNAVFSRPSYWGYYTRWKTLVPLERFQGGWIRPEVFIQRILSTQISALKQHELFNALMALPGGYGAELWRALEVKIPDWPLWVQYTLSVAFAPIDTAKKSLRAWITHFKKTPPEDTLSYFPESISSPSRSVSELPLLVSAVLYRIFPDSPWHIFPELKDLPLDKLRFEFCFEVSSLNKFQENHPYLREISNWEILHKTFDYALAQGALGEFNERLQELVRKIMFSPKEIMDEWKNQDCPFLSTIGKIDINHPVFWLFFGVNELYRRSFPRLWSIENQKYSTRYMKEFKDINPRLALRKMDISQLSGLLSETWKTYLRKEPNIPRSYQGWYPENPVEEILFFPVLADWLESNWNQLHYTEILRALIHLENLLIQTNTGIYLPLYRVLEKLLNQKLAPKVRNKIREILQWPVAEMGVELEAELALRLMAWMEDISPLHAISEMTPEEIRKANL